MANGRWSQTEADDMLDRCLNPFRQSLIGTDSIAITANTEVQLTCNAATRNVVSGPTYFTDRWDATDSKMTAVSEYDTPTYVGDIGFTWDQTTSSVGRCTVRVYIDDSGTQNFSADPEIRSYSFYYIGTAPLKENTVATWYWGTETGYDAKNDGVYFTVEFQHSGTLTAPSINIYNTQ